MKKKIKKQTKLSNIICSCGAKYRFDGTINQGALYCFICGREIIFTNRFSNYVKSLVK